ncbi:MAG TPA: Flp family type IVb pilin [Micropepsaceae bacterium]|jgi:pilus assembly protein Flp/PilA|nr:Flp family type IVb pilin [Micropepsaceae bacterium]
MYYLSKTAVHSVSRNIAQFLSVDSEKGVTAIEYGLIASLVAIAIIVGITLVGTNLNSLFNFIGGKVAPPAAP